MIFTIRAKPLTGRAFAIATEDPREAIRSIHDLKEAGLSVTTYDETGRLLEPNDLVRIFEDDFTRIRIDGSVLRWMRRSAKRRTAVRKPIRSVRRW